MSDPRAGYFFQRIRRSKSSVWPWPVPRALSASLSAGERWGYNMRMRIVKTHRNNINSLTACTCMMLRTRQSRRWTRDSLMCPYALSLGSSDVTDTDSHYAARSIPILWCMYMCPTDTHAHVYRMYRSYQQAPMCSPARGSSSELVARSRYWLERLVQ